MKNKGVCWIDGEVKPASEAMVSVYDHGLLYGDGIFEGIRFYNKRAFRLDEHLNRLYDSSCVLGITLPMSLEDISLAIKVTIHAYQSCDGYIRLVITRGVGSLGINPVSCRKPTMFIIADELQMIDEDKRKEGVKLIVSSTRRLAADGLDPRVKSLNYLNHIMAKMEANHADADEALLLNAQGNIAEGTADNVFIVKKDVLCTPPVTEGALEGITRNIVLGLAGELNIKVQVKVMSTFDVYTADECFLTGTAAELICVASVDGRCIGETNGRYFNMLNAAYRNIIASECC